MAPTTELDNKAEEWFNQYLPKLRYKQDYTVFMGDSKPLIKDGKNIGISITRPHTSFYATGITKLYQLIVLGETWPDVKYTEEEEAEFTREYNEKYGAK